MVPCVSPGTTPDPMCFLGSLPGRSPPAGNRFFPPLPGCSQQGNGSLCFSLPGNPVLSHVSAHGPSPHKFRGSPLLPVGGSGRFSRVAVRRQQAALGAPLVSHPGGHGPCWERRPQDCVAGSESRSCSRARLRGLRSLQQGRAPPRPPIPWAEAPP